MDEREQGWRRGDRVRVVCDYRIGQRPEPIPAGTIGVLATPPRYIGVSDAVAERLPPGRDTMRTNAR